MSEHKELKEFGSSNISQGVNLWRISSRSPPLRLIFAVELATGHRVLAELLSVLKPPEGDLAAADKSWARLLVLREELVKAFPESVDYRNRVAMTHSRFADRFLKTGKDAEAGKHMASAMAELHRAVELGFDDAHHLKTAIDYKVLQQRPEFLHW